MHIIKFKKLTSGEDVENCGIEYDDGGPDEVDMEEDVEIWLLVLKLLLLLNDLEVKLKMGCWIEFVLFVLAPSFAASSLDQLSWDSEEWKSHPKPESSESMKGATYSVVNDGGRFPYFPLPVKWIVLKLYYKYSLFTR